MKYHKFFKKFSPFFALCCLGVAANAQIVNIPDQNFKNALLNHSPVIDTNNDGEIQQSEAQTATVLDVQGQAIQDLTGIATFVNITDLNCSNNQLINLSLEQNTQLEYLYCDSNQLISLDVDQCTNLKWLHCSNNNLTALDISQNTGLWDLVVSNNQLTSMDITQNTQLNYFNCISNQLTVLNISQNTSLNGFDCSDNQLIALDVSNNVDLQILTCAHNDITNLDLTQNINLLTFAGQDNDFTFLDARNGTNMDILLFDVQQNPNLTCIFVDDAIYSENDAYWFRDPASTYVETQAQCDALGTNDLTFQQLMVYPNPVNMRFYITNPRKFQIEKVDVYDVLGKKVKSFLLNTGIYDITNLQNGLYFIKIYNGNKILTRKIIKK